MLYECMGLELHFLYRLTILYCIVYFVIMLSGVPLFDNNNNVVIVNLTLPSLTSQFTWRPATWMFPDWASRAEHSCRPDESLSLLGLLISKLTLQVLVFRAVFIKVWMENTGYTFLSECQRIENEEYNYITIQDHNI